jgi:hypothetical protein
MVPDTRSPRYNVAQLYAMLGESIRNGKKEPLL